MATKAMIEKWKREPKHSTRGHNRCRICGRPRGYMGKFAMCRMCFRQLAHQGQIPGIRKSSW
ncbi:MAG TPA: type Z 30S ribosomal protein S14 [Bacillota bacterium]|nr:type Z 30S ribosomal protein S14 [Bacillota bacterium]